MKAFFQKIIQNQIIMAIVSIVFGVILIAWRNEAVAGILKIMGYLLLVAAAVTIITYFFGKENKGNPSTLAAFILLLVIGLIFIFSPHWLISFFPFVMGLILIISSVFNISSLISNPLKTGMFATGLGLSILTLILGIIAVVNPSGMASILITFIGVTFFINGITDLVAVIWLKKVQ